MPVATALRTSCEASSAASWEILLSTYKRKSGAIWRIICSANRFGFVLCAQAGLLPGNGVLAVKNARSAEQDESRFHN
jgi:hypothetical protein